MSRRKTNDSVGELTPLLAISYDHDEPCGSESHRADSSPRYSANKISQQKRPLCDDVIEETPRYNEYNTIDWPAELVKDSYRLRRIRGGNGLKRWLYRQTDACSGWIAVATVGVLTACIAFVVDMCETTVSDWKLGYCMTNPILGMDECCKAENNTLRPKLGRLPGFQGPTNFAVSGCSDWHVWTPDWWKRFAVYSGFAILFGIISASATTFTNFSMTRQLQRLENKDLPAKQAQYASKSFPMAAGSGIPEIKTILNGFEIPHYLNLQVLLVKAFGAIFAVASGMCLGKEGPFVHVSACVGNLIAQRIPKYGQNRRKLREILAAAVAAGLSVAFGAPIGGILFAYEEISTYFPRKVLWRAFLCSMSAAIVLKALSPTGTDKLVLFEIKYATSYPFSHYGIFIMLGIAGGIWGGGFCRLNYCWSKWFRSFSIIKNYPVLEIAFVVLVTSLLQYPNPLTRDPGDTVFRNLLVNCADDNNAAQNSFICRSETSGGHDRIYICLLIIGCLVKLVLTTITFGTKVPSGIIIPALGAGGLFGRLIGLCLLRLQASYHILGSNVISPGLFAMVGGAAFLAGVSRMTISLCVVMFELTGELEYVLPHMVAVIVAKWIADAITEASIYDVAQSILSHPFLDYEQMLVRVQAQSRAGVVDVQDNAHSLGGLVSSAQQLADITVSVPRQGSIRRSVLSSKLALLRSKSICDEGLILVSEPDGVFLGYLEIAELVRQLQNSGGEEFDPVVRLFDHSIRRNSYDLAERPSGSSEDIEQFAARHRGPSDGKPLNQELDLSQLVDRTPLSMCVSTPMERVVEAFGKLGLGYLLATKDGSGTLAGICSKKRIIQYLEELKQ